MDRRLSGMREFSPKKYTSLINISTYTSNIENQAPMSSRDWFSDLNELYFIQISPQSGEF